MNHIFKSAVLLSTIILIVGCNDDRKFNSDGNVPSGCDVLGGNIAKGLDITDVAVYQAVRIPFLEDGQSVNSDNAPVVAGKDAMVRVHVSRQADFASRDIYIRIEFDGGTQDLCPIEEVYNVSGDSDINTITSTLNVFVPGDYIEPGVEFAVSVREASDTASGSGNSNLGRWPSDGTTSFNAKDTHGPLKVVIVPIQYDADGSGRLPELSDAQLQIYEDLFYATYPVPEVEIEVLDPLPWSSQVSAYGQGWDTLLNKVTEFRGQNGAEYEEYYFGAFSPASSLYDFCGSGCVAGLCNLAEQPTMSYARACIGLGFAGPEAADTMIHEVGHAHGRWHAPSGGAQGIDPAYPYAGGGIGVYGYDIVDEALKNPAQYVDFMGYGTPTWVSDYTYEALYQRVIAVNQQADWIHSPDFNEWWPTIAVGIDGSVSDGPTLRLTSPPSGQPHEIDFLSQDGETIRTVTGYYSRYDHFDAGFIIYPEPESEVYSVQLPGFEAIAI